MKTLEEAAKTYAGNWLKFECFYMDTTELEKPEDWMVYYTHNRNSKLTDLSNKDVIDEVFNKFPDDATPVRHSHWAVGWVKGWLIKIYENNEITEVCKQLFEIEQKLEKYPILNETDYSEKEYEQTLKNIKEVAITFYKQYQLPENWEVDVYELIQNESNELENCDDDGGWPSEKSVKKAFKKLKWKKVA